jgi:hypothetical protein
MRWEEVEEAHKVLSGQAARRWEEVEEAHKVLSEQAAR